MVERAQVLFDDEGQFVDFDGPVVEEGFAFCDCGGVRVSKSRVLLGGWFVCAYVLQVCLVSPLFL